jgi:glycine/D-amino acid oxidase-like deaminating enzyme
LQRRWRTAILPDPEVRRFAAEAHISSVHLQEAILKSFIGFALISFALATPALAQGLVDPSKVAPEYREAAEKRRAEQIRQRDCAKKAEAEKVVPRERTAFLLHCLDELEAAGANGTTPAAAVTAPTPSSASNTTTH